MRLFSLLSHLPAVRPPVREPEEEIAFVCSDSHKAAPGCLFVCLRGPVQDGHHYAKQAYDRGCRMFVCEYPPPDLPEDAILAYVPDGRHALGHLSSAICGYPERDLTLIGITGTKGKTTTAVMIYRLLLAHGIPAGYIGSNGVQYADVCEKTENTTPDAPALRRIFAAMREASVRVAVIEVSSQAICCERIAGLTFPICLFTNLAKDHIGEGEHPDYAHYRAAKARLFSDYGCHSIIVNADDETAPYMIAASSAVRVRTVSLSDSTATLSASHIRPVRTEEGFGVSFFLQAEKEGPLPLFLHLPGECNVSNALLALTAVREYLVLYEPEKDVSLRSLALTLEQVRVEGRFEKIETALTGVDLVIDYAHNGYSLTAALAALRAYEPTRLICLFGSVGGRTYTRRAELGEAACAADLCIVTTDNPDSEPPESTMREICAVLDEHGREYVAIPDRAAAIRYAVSCAEPGDIVLLAGKGHEDYQLIAGKRVPFRERDLVLAAVEEKNAAYLGLP